MPVGTLVYKYGISSGLTSGKITSNYVTSSREGIYLREQTLATYYAEGGDSGAPVFTIGEVENGSFTCRLMGIHSGSNTSTGIAGFSKYYNIVNELGITVITD